MRPTRGLACHQLHVRVGKERAPTKRRTGCDGDSEIAFIGHLDGVKLIVLCDQSRPHGGADHKEYGRETGRGRCAEEEDAGFDDTENESKGSEA
jgi:hypothetical protein